MGEPYHIIATLHAVTGLISYNFSRNYTDRVYLCKEDKQTNNAPIYGFKCYRYNSLDQAVRESEIQNASNTRHAIIPICKWVPAYFDKYILDRKLKHVFWLGNHTIFHPKAA